MISAQQGEMATSRRRAFDRVQGGSAAKQRAGTSVLLRRIIPVPQDKSSFRIQMLAAPRRQSMSHPLSAELHIIINSGTFFATLSGGANSADPVLPPLLNYSGRKNT
jgi:hypothetical protein